MAFPRPLFWSLLGPLIVLVFPYGFALLVMHSNPGSSLEQRGAGVLLVVAAAATLIELVAVPVAIYCQLRYRDYRTVGNAALTMVALIPLALLTLFVGSILYGHG